MVLELTNTSSHELKFTIGGDGNEVGLNITGDGVVFYPTDPRDPISLELRLGTVVTLAPGKTYALPITSLRSGFRGMNRAYWTEPGEYKVTASFMTPISPAPKGAEKAFGSAIVTSEPITVKVEAQEKQPNVNLYSESCAPGVIRIFHADLVRRLHRHLQLRRPLLLLLLRFLLANAQRHKGGRSRGNRRAIRLHPLGAQDLAVMPVAGGVLDHVAGTFIEVVQGQRVGVRLEALGRREVLGVASDL